MKIIIDATFVNKRNLTSSIPVFLFRFISAIPQEKKKEFTILALYNEYQIFDKMFPDIQKKYLAKDIILNKTPKIRYYYWRYVYKKYVSKEDYDIFFIVNEYNDLSTFKTSKRKVVLIHDLKGLKDPNPKDDKRRNYNFYRHIIDSANHIIAISQFTKKDIISYLKIPDKKISVVYNSVQLSKNENCPKGFNVKDYILYVNTLSEYKNVYTLLKAYKELRDEKTKYILVIVGRSSSYWEEKMLPYIEKNHLSSYIVHLQNLTNEELKYMYSHASLFVTTSTREGFGYTPIEAAMCECPVVSSTCEALPDTTQGLVTYYEPVYDEHALKQKMLEALKTPQSKLVLIKNKFLYDYSPKVQFEKIYKILSND